MNDVNSKMGFNNIQAPEGMKQVFVSYHWADLIKNQQGFGNMVLGMSLEIYQNNLGKLVFDLTKQVKLIIDEKLDVDSSVEVLFFR